MIWNPSITIDGGGDYDTLYLYQSNTTLDLRPVLTHVESLYLGDSNLTALVDANVLAGLTNISGSSGSNIVTDEAAADLTGKSASARSHSRAQTPLARPSLSTAAAWRS